MTDYYCDLGEETWADNVGTATGTAYTGPAGLQAALRGTGNATALVAGDDLWIKTGTGDQSRLVWLDVDTDVSTWPLGASVRNDLGAPDEWVGTVVQVNYGGNNDQILIWLNSGFTESDITLANGIFYAVGPWNQGLDAKDTKGIEIDTNSGSAGSPITFAGVNASWSEDGTRATLDANDLATYNIVSAGKDYLHFRNLIGANAADIAFAATSAATYCHFENVRAADPANGGFDNAGGSWQWGSMTRCRAYGFSTYGFRIYQQGLSFCRAYGGIGASYGFYLYASSAVECVAYEIAAGYGFYLHRGSQLLGFVSDSNKYGVTAGSAGCQATGGRITNNTTYGIAGTNLLIDIHCFYSGNGANFQSDIHLPNIDGASTRITTGTVGYIDGDNATLADRNYGLTNQAAARRQEVDL